MTSCIFDNAREALDAFETIVASATKTHALASQAIARAREAIHTASGHQRRVAIDTVAACLQSIVAGADYAINHSVAGLEQNVSRLKDGARRKVETATGTIDTGVNDVVAGADKAVAAVESGMARSREVIHGAATRGIAVAENQIDGWRLLTRDRAYLGHRMTTVGIESVIEVKPLERVEIDHTVLDLMVIDDQTGLPLGRPTLTVALDCATRCIHGFHVGFEPPSYLAVSRCLNHALLPKTYLKSEYPDIDGDWPCFGAMEYLVVDNGLEFHADALESAARQFGITIQYCPRAKPWFKGKVERFIGTMNRAVAHGKPGTTFENIFERGDYDSKKTATITLSVLKHLIHIWVIKYYHQRVHSSIHKRPDTAWKEGIEVTKIPVTDQSPVDLTQYD